jgi:triacylglycerol lipase
MKKTSTDELQLRHPTVLVHGLGAKSKMGVVDYFWDLPKRLRSAGNEIFIPNLSFWHTLERRGSQLQAQIEERFPDPSQKINLIGHSMGGIDCRYLVSKLGFSDRVASVTTVGSPNNGSVLCDVAVGLVPDEAFNRIESILERLGISNEGFRQLTTRYHNDVLSTELKDAPGVAYYSATSVIRGSFYRTSLPIFWLSEKILRRYEGENDGFVSEQSSKHGTHITTYYGDHYGQIGQILGRTRGLDYVAFFKEIVSRLRKDGL